MADKTIICRCEDLSLEEIREWIAQGYRDLNEIKRISRAGMGPCQGRTCRNHLLRELAKAAGKPVEEMGLTTFRPPTKPLKIGKVLGVEEDA